MCGPPSDEHRRGKDENAEQGDATTHDNISHFDCFRYQIEKARYRKVAMGSPSGFISAR